MSVKNDMPAVKWWGTVKWYDVTKKWGFVHLSDTNEDVFVHWSALDTTYPLKCLFKGECVQVLEIEETEKGKQATKVTGVNGGELLCVQNKQLTKLLNMSQTLPILNWQQTNRRGKGVKSEQKNRSDKSGKDKNIK